MFFRFSTSHTERTLKCSPGPCVLFALWLGSGLLGTNANAQQDSTGFSIPKEKPLFRSADRYGDPFSNEVRRSPLFLKNPTNLTLDLEIDTALNYTIYEQIGNLHYRPASEISFLDFKKYQERELLRSYWQSKSRAQDGESAVSGRSLNPKIFISPALDRIFGGSYVELVPRGFVTLDLGASFQRLNNPSIPIRQQRSGGFEFDQQINMSVTGKVGEKLSVTANFDNNNSFDFQNSMKVEYTGFKEDILQKLELGNVSLPLNNTLIQGSQSLFGVKAQLQFGKMKATAIASTQRGKVSSVNIDGSNSGQSKTFEIIASAYNENRHFFLCHFFREHYEQWISNTPQIISGITITRVEVYVLNRNNDTQTVRNVMGLMDLAEGRTIYNASVISNGTSLPADNGANNLFSFVTSQDRSVDGVSNMLESFFSGNNNAGTDFEKMNGARKLASTEFTFHNQLGYLTLTRKLQNDEVLAVAYEYTYNGRSYKVGELSEDYSSLPDDHVVFLKLLRPGRIAIKDNSNKIIPTWNLMMKNIYSLDAANVSATGFELRVIYRDDASGIDNPQLQEGATVRTRQLIEILGLDKLNSLGDRQRDGNFDYVEGVTINSTSGFIIFPYLEPFSDGLRNAFEGESLKDHLIQKYCYDTLYGTTQSDASLFSARNKFYLMGEYAGSTSGEISLSGFGITQGSVKVYAGGLSLSEGTDFVVDYTFSKVTIINESILNSGKDIEVQYEQNDAFSMQTKSLVGTRLDYQFNEDINLGSTFLYYNERPQTSRNTVGTEPARNVQYGLDFNVNKKSRFLTKMVDALPILQTKEESSISFSGEFAQLIPGTSNVIEGEGTGYIDDFENTATYYSLLSAAAWSLSSVPQADDHEFDAAAGMINDLRAGFKRAKIAWYTVDNQLQRDGGSYRPDNITDRDLQNHYIRGVDPQEIFPNKQLSQATYFEQILDIGYYPNERGPYNYNTALTSEGLLPSPKENWGAITMPIRTETDFDKANIGYIEFWLLDPFINLPSGNGKVLDGIFNESNDSGGQIVFHLGSISEDITRDGKHAFENGLPSDGNTASGEVTSNAWGYVTSQQYLTNSFDYTSSGARINQDVGLDGMPDDKESEYFNDYLNALSATGASKIQEDPSGDNFSHFLDSRYDKEDAKILERYKAYNGQEGNSPVSSADISYSSYLTPDNEDLNDDNTLNEVETYYQYEINLKPGQLEINSEYVVDKITTTQTNSQGESVTWYQFRIPVQDYKRKYGNIEGFKSIKYIRMLLTGFEQPVVLRLANFRMTGSYWRRYTETLLEGGFTTDQEPGIENLILSTVNLEENAMKDVAANKSGYVIPPGVERDRDNTSSVSRLLNEQSVQICIDGLADGDARAIYKNTSADLFNYGRIKMFFHANSESDDGALFAFLRMGTDLDENYYEIEIPLQVSDPSDGSERGVWPEENEIDLALSELYTLKTSRDLEGFSLTESYPRADAKTVGRHGLRIVGRPDLSSVLAIMIGVRNPKTADKRAHSACVWANELRVTDFDRTAGWAITSAMNMKLADFAIVSGSLRHTTAGFGSISSKISERTRDETTTYDLSASVNLEKLLPANTGIKIPMFVSYESSTATPSYDPANPDVKLNASLEAFASDEDRQDYLSMIREKGIRRSLNFSNVRKTKVRPDARPHLWDVENLSFTYSYSDQAHKGFTTAEALQQQQKASAGYSFSTKGTGVEPFKNARSLSSPWLKLIKDFNINLMPTNMAIRMDLDRSFTKTIYRTASGSSFIESDPSYLKYFTFNRQYNLQWNISKNLGIEYSATARAVIDEPAGELDTRQKRDSVMANLRNFGRLKNFDQKVSVNYTLPLDKLPLTDWISTTYQYSTSYSWDAGTWNKPDSLIENGEDDLVDSLDFKNTIANTRAQNLTGRMDLVKLYNKVSFLRQLNTLSRSEARKPTTVTKTPMRVATDTSKVRSLNQQASLSKKILRLLMSLRSLNASYSLTEGTILPGFTRSPKFFGMDENWKNPGWSFILGSQDPALRFQSAERGLITTNTSLTSLFTQSRNESIDLRANLEPSSSFKIQVDFKKQQTSSYGEIFRYDREQSESESGFASLSPSRSGSYNLSFMSIKTAFKRSNDDIESQVFRDFENNLITVKNRLREFTGREYDTASQDVLIPGFIAAYTGKNSGSIAFTPFPKVPKPNWRLDYTGLTSIPFLKDYFQTVTISHAYQSTYSVTNYTSSLRYDNINDLRIDRSIEDYNSAYFGTGEEDKIVPVYVISQVVISEQFVPLIGINVRTKSRMTANLQYKTRRDLALTVSNSQVTETAAKEWSCEFGFTKNNLKLPFRSNGRTIVLKNDVTIRMNLTVSDTHTFQRKISDVNTLTSGNVSFQLRPTISYVLNSKLSLQFYFTRTINEPLVSNSYRKAETSAGLQMRFSLAQ